MCVCWVSLLLCKARVVGKRLRGIRLMWRIKVRFEKESRTKTDGNEMVWGMLEKLNAGRVGNLTQMLLRHTHTLEIIH